MRLASLATLACTLAIMAALGACADAHPQLVQAPSAQLVVRSADAGVLVGIVELLGKANVVDITAGAPRLLVANKADLVGKPFVASLLPSGAWIVATRIPKGAAWFTPGEALAGKTKRATLAEGEHGSVLIRIDGDRALLGFPNGTDALSLAGLLEALGAMSTNEARPHTPGLPPDDAVHVRANVGPLSGADVLVRIDGAAKGTLRAEVPGREPLTLAAPPWSCAFDDAAAVLAIPESASSVLKDQAGLATDSFTGALLLAVYPPAAGETTDPNDPLSLVSLVASGVPRDDKALAALTAAAQEAAGTAATVTTRDGTTRIEVNGKRRLRIVAQPGTFALAIGQSAPIERVTAGAPCPGGSRRAPLFMASGARLAPIVLPALVTPEVILRALGGANVDDALPLARLRGIRSVSIETDPAWRATVALDVPE